VIADTEGLTNLQTGTIASAQSQSVENVDHLTRQFLDKVIDLEKLNANFRLRTGIVSPWRQRRVFLYGEANAMCTEASQIEAMVVRYSILRNSPQKPISGASAKTAAGNAANQDIEKGDDEIDQATSFPFTGTATGRVPNTVGRLMTANSVGIVGNSIGATGDIIELNLNLLNYLGLRKDHLNPSSYKSRVGVLHGQISKLGDQRNDAIKSGQFSDSELAVINAETKVLADFKDLSLVEYSNFHASTKRFWAFQNTAFLVDLLKNTVAGSGGVVGITGSHLRNPFATGTSGILSICSGGLVMLTPFFGRVTGNLAGTASRRLISKELIDVQAHKASEFASARLQLSAALLHKPDMEAARRLAIYKKEEELLVKMEKSYANQKDQARATLIENIAFAAAIGPPRIANGAMQILGAYHYHPNRRRANVLYTAGATTYASSTAVNILETARVQAGIEISNSKRGQAGAMPKQQITKRLSDLDGMRAQLHGTKL
jgi:hypothetical protein